MDSHLERDIFAAAFLIVNGCKLESLEPTGRFRYGFRFSNGHATSLVQDFYNHAECSARDYAAALRDLKGQLYQQKRIGNGEKIHDCAHQQ
jgi:hypothetical protein